MKIKNWEKFQHFKDRNPPWVKLHKCLLDDPDWHNLDGDAAKILTMLWLVASEDKDHSGNLPDLRKLAFRFRMSEIDLKQIISRLYQWLDHTDITPIQCLGQTDNALIQTPEQVDINVISQRYQPVSDNETERYQAVSVDENLETERYHLDAPETETETETETDTLSGKPDDAAELLDYLNRKTGRGYRKVEANLRLIRGRLKDGATPDDIRRVIDQKTEQWKNDPTMAEYLRPATLFGAQKFEQYLGAIETTATDNPNESRAEAQRKFMMKMMGIAA